MRRRALAILGVLVVAATTCQTDADATHRVRSVMRASRPATPELRDAFRSWPLTTRSGHSNYDRGLAAESKSCDIIWCYEN